MLHFQAQIEIIGVNPYVLLPDTVLQNLFQQAGKDRGKIPVRMKIDGHEFTQTLVKYSGHWRLYLNMPMRKAAGKDVGDTAAFEVEFDPQERTVPMHPKFRQALDAHPAAARAFERLSPSRQLEILRYLAALKTEASIDRNVDRAMRFLTGEARFAGRDKP